MRRLLFLVPDRNKHGRAVVEQLEESYRVLTIFISETASHMEIGFRGLLEESSADCVMVLIAYPDSSRT